MIHNTEVEELVRAFFRAEYPRCFHIAGKTLDSLSESEKAKTLLICSVAMMFEGLVNESGKTTWLKTSIDEQMQIGNHVSDYLLQLQAFEASKLAVEGKPKIALSIIRECLSRCGSGIVRARLSFFLGMHYLNASKDAH